MSTVKQFAMLALVLLIACGRPGPDPVLVGSPDCTLPCWRTIEPGRTTEAQALAVLRGMDGVFSLTVEEPVTYFGYDEHTSNSIHVDPNHVVDRIELELEDTTLEQVVARFGEPTHILFGLDSGGCGFDAFLPTMGLTFGGHCSPSLFGEGWPIVRGTNVSLVYATAPGLSADEMLTILAGADEARIRKGGIQPWGGYGVYDWPP